MAITMQGSWLVRSKAKNAAFAQRFVITGASRGNGIYTGQNSGPFIWVEGDNWQLEIQHRPGRSGPYVPSAERLTPPTSSGSTYRFDIQSNDSGGDTDFNDLIVECLMPVSANDYLVYGKVSVYDPPCIFNPCFPGFIVIDSFEALQEAVRFPELKDNIDRLYPGLIKRFNPQPDPPVDFKPLMIPYQQGGNLPEPEILSVRTSPQVFKIAAKSGHKSQAAIEIPYTGLETLSTQSLSQATQALLPAEERLRLSRWVDRFKLFCDSSPLRFTTLRFQEYDRTAAEKSGAPYSGTGPRENLGLFTTDMEGNYIFRFRRDLSDVLGEWFADTAPGESISQSIRPDLIAQLLGGEGGTTVICETGMYANIPQLRRLNICFSADKVEELPPACDQHGNIIQTLGNIYLGPLNPATGRRDGFSNHLSNEGIVTARDSAPTPNVSCAAWKGTLTVYGCMNNPAIQFYAVRYVNLTALAAQAAPNSVWREIPESLTQRRYDSLYPGITHTENVEVEMPLALGGGPKVSAKAFRNIEVDSTKPWLAKSRITKAVLFSGNYQNGPVSFRFEGFDQDGNAVPGADEIVTLYIDNAPVSRDILDTVTMGTTPLGNCALFTLPEGEPGKGIKVKFKVDQPSGFMNHYALSMTKGATGAFSVQPNVVNAEFPGAGPAMNAVANRGRRFVYGGNPHACDLRFRGTPNETLLDALGYYETELTPSSGRWLEPNQTFCAFSIDLNGRSRHTNGTTGYPKFSATRVLIGIQKADTSSGTTP